MNSHEDSLSRGTWYPTHSLSQILNVPHLRKSITGFSQCVNRCDKANILTSNLQNFLYSSMMNSFVPSIISTTHDITEIVRLARLIWPEYVSSLNRRLSTSDHSPGDLAWQVLKCLQDDVIGVSDNQCCNVDGCYFCLGLHKSTAKILSHAGERNSLQQKLSEMLDKSIRDQMRSLLSTTAMMPGRVLPTDSIPYALRLPYVTKFLLLAAFLCQTKGASQDVNLYTTTNTGKIRGARHSNVSNEGSANVLSSKSVIQHYQQQSYFRLERMLSVFYSIISQYGHGNYVTFDARVDKMSTCAPLGSMQLFRCIMMLIATNLLQISGGAKVSEQYDNNVLEMVSAKFSCTLCQDDAFAIATSVGLPLQKYCP